MSMQFVKTLAVVGALALAGCSYNLSLISNTTGDEVAKGTVSKYHNIVSITLDRKIYSGHYAYSDTPVALASYAQSMPTPAGIVVGVDARGRGTISAETGDRDELRCVFDYNQDAQSGSGQCVTQGGRVFALKIQSIKPLF